MIQSDSNISLRHNETSSMCHHVQNDSHQPSLNMTDILIGDQVIIEKRKEPENAMLTSTTVKDRKLRDKVTPDEHQFYMSISEYFMSNSHIPDSTFLHSLATTSDRSIAAGFISSQYFQLKLPSWNITFQTHVDKR